MNQWEDVRSSRSNATQSSIEEQDDEVGAELENMDLAEFKERYRRLIPYMTYYVANNYVNSQVLGNAQQQQQKPTYERDLASPMSSLTRKPQRLVPIGTPSDPRRKPSSHRTSNTDIRRTMHKQKDKFVPSFQYDPKNIGADTDYFTPVRYNIKLNSESAEYNAANHYRGYDRQQHKPLVYTDASTAPPITLQQDVRYFVEDQPYSRPYNPIYERNDQTHKHKVSPVNLQQDYLLEYGTRTSNNKGAAHYSYPSDDFESVRYVNIESPSRIQAKPTRILAQSIQRRPLMQSPAALSQRYTTTPLHDIMKSLQLTNRLPEILNRDNIDSSIKTLVEILSILQSAKQTDYPRLSENDVTPVPPHRNFTNYDNFKRVYNPPKVVTETRFQATPRPPAHTKEQSLGFRMKASYETTRKTKVNSNYEIDNDHEHDGVVKYNTPLIQDVDEKAEHYRPVEKPGKNEDEYNYETGEDLADEENNELGRTTEAPIRKYQLTDGASTHSQLVPPTTLKYGSTRGKPNVDYPAYAKIPETEFNCKEQRYKGFFGDPSTGCQVREKQLHLFRFCFLIEETLSCEKNFEIFMSECLE